MKKLLIPIIIIILVIAGAWAVFGSDTEQDSADQAMQNKNANSEVAENKNTNVQMEKESDSDTTVDENAARYVEYSPETFKEASGSRRVLFFYANWCPICKPADEDFRDNADVIPADVVVIRVNYNDTATDDAEEALAQTYGITYQHTFVQIDANGQQVTKWNGGDTTELLENIQ